VAAPRTPPSEIDWGSLSPAARVRHITLRAAAGFDYQEIAEQLQAARPAFRHLTVPAGKPITKLWVAARARELRREVEQSGAAQYSPSAWRF
jgi:hypothetical protein